MKALTRLTTRLTVVACVGLPLFPAAAGPCSGINEQQQHQRDASGPKQEVRYIIHTPRGSTDCLDRVVVRGR